MVHPEVKKKILVIYGSVGQGHKAVALNIMQALKAYPGIEIEELDIMALYRGGLTTGGAGVYNFLISSLPWLWRFFYTNKFFLKLTLPGRAPFASLKIRRFREYLQAQEPDLILTTHTIGTALVSYLKTHRQYRGPVVTTFSDFHFQPYWVYPGVDRYLVMLPEQREAVSATGFPEAQITVTGLPVDQAFLQEQDVGEIFQKYRLSKTRPVILVMGGSLGWGIRIEDIRELLGSDLDLQVVIITGNNPQLEKELQDWAADYEYVRVLGNLPARAVAELFTIAKILLTKPGGLTMAQALVKRLPMILVNPIPGGEEENLQYIITHGAAVAAKTAYEVRTWAQRLLQDKKYYQALRERAKSLARPDAAAIAAGAIIDTLNFQD